MQLARVDPRIIGKSSNLAAVLAKAAIFLPEVLLMEDEGEGGNSAHLMLRIRQVSRNTRVVILCGGSTPRLITGLVQSGAQGCLLKGSDPSVCAKAVMTVHRGAPWFGRTELLEALRSQLAAMPDAAPAALGENELLTPREREILALARNGFSNKGIARQLDLSDKTVKTHLHRIYVKLGRRGRYKLLLGETDSPRPLGPS